MKKLVSFSIVTIIIGCISSAEAQNVIEGDSAFHTLKPGKSRASDILRTLGRPNSTTEVLAPFHVLFSNGGDGHGMRLYGYAFNYRKPRVQFVLDEDKTRLMEIRFGPKASITTEKGIQPGKNTFGEVLERYGKLNPETPDQGEPKIQGRIVNWKKGGKYTLLRYPGITFVSYGKWVREEDITQRQVNEIWLH